MQRLANDFQIDLPSTTVVAQTIDGEAITIPFEVFRRIADAISEVDVARLPVAVLQPPRLELELIEGGISLLFDLDGGGQLSVVVPGHPSLSGTEVQQLARSIAADLERLIEPSRTN